MKNIDWKNLIVDDERLGFESEDLTTINALNNLIINTLNIKKYHINLNKDLSKSLSEEGSDYDMNPDFAIYYLLYYYDEDKMTNKFNHLCIFEKKHSDKTDITETLTNDNIGVYGCGGVPYFCILLSVDKIENEIYIDRFYEGTVMDEINYDHIINEKCVKRMINHLKKVLFKKLMKQQQEKE